MGKVEVYNTIQLLTDEAIIVMSDTLIASELKILSNISWTYQHTF
jgi:hypothetical protein